MSDSEKRKLFIEKLENLTFGLVVLDENPFKIKAIRNAAILLQSSEESLSDISKGKVKIKGIGAGIQALLSEFLETGELKELEKVLTQVPKIVFEMAEIPGLGPKKAFLIYQELNIGSLAELEYACRENRLLTLKGFGEAIQKKVLEGLEKKQALQGKLRIDQALSLAQVLKEKLKPKQEWLLVGEVARSNPVCSGIEVLVSESDLNFKKLNWLVKPILSKTETSLLSVLSGELLENEFQSSVRFWILASEKSKQELLKTALDLTLPPELVLKKEERLLFEEKKAPFSWLEPETVKRLSGKNWYQRSKQGKVRGVFHCHTTESDGSATLEQMVKQAEELGYAYIGISDHSQSAFYAQGLKEDRVLSQHEQILKLQKKTKIKIFHGIESDILADGSLDYPDKVLKEFDFVIGSIHSRFKMDKNEMTKRIQKALSHPSIHFWGHPTGRILLGRKGYELDWDACLKTAAENKVCVELNANPHRLDIDWSLGPLIDRYQVSLSINPDAHDLEGLEDTYYGELMAEKAGINSDLILNLKNLDEVEAFFQ